MKQHAETRGGTGPDEPMTTIELVKVDGQTLVHGREPLDEPAWHWPKR
jgi:hypothetical protein